MPRRCESKKKDRTGSPISPRPTELRTRSPSLRHYEPDKAGLFGETDFRSELILSYPERPVRLEEGGLPRRERLRIGHVQRRATSQRVSRQACGFFAQRGDPDQSDRSQARGAVLIFGPTPLSISSRQVCHRAMPSSICQDCRQPLKVPVSELRGFRAGAGLGCSFPWQSLGR